MAFPGGGGNPRYGRDTGGSLPPSSSGGQQPYNPYAYPFGGAGPARFAPPLGYTPPGYPRMAPAAVQMSPSMYGMPPFGVYAPSPVMMHPAAAAAASGFGRGTGPGRGPGGGPGPIPVPIPVSGPGPSPSPGHGPSPLHEPDFRTCSLRNSTGGYGCEPGYNYFFPEEHTKIHVLKTGPTPPWQLPANFWIAFHACHVPVTTTGAELLRGFGARNPVPKKNVITEVTQGGGGKWYRGIELRGDNSAALKKPIKEFGWDGTRTGLRGQKKVVYVYVQRD